LKKFLVSVGILLAVVTMVAAIVLSVELTKLQNKVAAIESTAARRVRRAQPEPRVRRECLGLRGRQAKAWTASR
jgi:hypothetical protein